MKIIKVETWDLGNSIDAAVSSAHKMAVEHNAVIEFVFNQCICRVSPLTNPHLLVRDFMTHYIMDWKEVGPDCVLEYSTETLKHIKEKQEAQDKRRADAQAEYGRKEKEKLGAITKKLQGIEFEVTDPKALKKWEDTNTDGYGAAIIEYAKQWGRLMQYEMAQGKNLEDIAEKASDEADTFGLTGFMYGASVNVLKSCWTHGEQLRKWHNKKYNHSGDGVVNPAILTKGIK